MSGHFENFRRQVHQRHFYRGLCKWITDQDAIHGVGQRLNVKRIFPNQEWRKKLANEVLSARLTFAAPTGNHCGFCLAGLALIVVNADDEIVRFRVFPGSTHNRKFRIHHLRDSANFDGSDFHGMNLVSSFYRRDDSNNFQPRNRSFCKHHAAYDSAYQRHNTLREMASHQTEQGSGQ